MQAAAAATMADWERLVAKALGERPLSSLDAVIADGVTVPPLSPAGSLPPLFARPGGWRRLARIDRADDAAMVSALGTGADGAAFVLEGTPLAFCGGVAVNALPSLLGAIDLDRVALRFEPGVASHAVCDAVTTAMARERLDAARVSIAFGFDPFGPIATGEIDAGGVDATLAGLAQAAVDLLAGGHRGPILSADARIVHEAGGDAVQELAFALAARATLLRRLDAAGIAEELLAGAVDVALAADSDQFATIAKLRAMRLLDARLLAAAGLAASPLRIHAATSFRMLAALDSRSNIIRTTIAALSAALGGADSIAVLPWSAANPSGDDGDGARLALTTQAILAEEAGLARVDDPAAGSGTIDGMTLALAKAAWAEFQAIEAAGGLAATLAQGDLQRRVLATARAAETRLGNGEAALVGVTLFRADGTQPPSLPMEAEPPATGFVPLAANRRAAPFEGGAT